MLHELKEKEENQRKKNEKDIIINKEKNDILKSHHAKQGSVKKNTIQHEMNLKKCMSSKMSEAQTKIKHCHLFQRKDSPRNIFEFSSNYQYIKKASK